MGTCIFRSVLHLFTAVLHLFAGHISLSGAAIHNSGRFIHAFLSSTQFFSSELCMNPTAGDLAAFAIHILDKKMCMPPSPIHSFPIKMCVSADARPLTGLFMHR